MFFHRLVTSALVAATAHASPSSFLTDITLNSGIDFVHQNGATGTKYACELIGAGGALIDFDGDGDLDLYLVNGAPLPGFSGGEIRNALYENVGFPAPGGSDGPAFRPPFRRTHDAAGAGDTGYGMGATVGDYDNDGDPDLYVTNFGRNTLYRNDGGRFMDVTTAAGVGDERWGTSAAFVDIDGDGLLDLYVCNYFKYRVEDHEWYGLRKDGYRTNGGPASFRPDTDVIYRNRGDGTFEDFTSRCGVDELEANFALGVVTGDFDNDGDADLYVSNDTQANWLLVNDGSGRFLEDAMIAGVAYDQSGKPQASMGIDAQDFNGDGLLDIFCTNFSLEPNTMYTNMGDGFFLDETYENGLGRESLPFLAFGAGFLDIENDRDLDLFVVNGHIMDNVPLYFDDIKYRERNQLFLNNGVSFDEASSGWGRAVTVEEASRAAIFGDLDNDGDTDIVVTNVAAAPQILRNDQPSSSGGWVRVILHGTKSNRDGYGASITVEAAGRSASYDARAAYSYLASNDPRVLAGLGDADVAEVIQVRWPSGMVDRIEKVPSGRAVLVTEGQGGKILPEGLRTFGWAMDENEF